MQAIYLPQADSFILVSALIFALLQRLFRVVHVNQATKPLNYVQVVQEKWAFAPTTLYKARNPSSRLPPESHKEDIPANVSSSFLNASYFELLASLLSWLTLSLICRAIVASILPFTGQFPVKRAPPLSFPHHLLPCPNTCSLHFPAPSSLILDKTTPGAPVEKESTPAP